MSRRPGIGREWYEKYKSDVYPSDECRIHEGQAQRPPRYYDELLRKQNPAMYDRVKAKRQTNGQCLKPVTKNGIIILLSDNDTVRLRVKEQCKIDKQSQNKRSLEENETQSLLTL